MRKRLPHAFGLSLDGIVACPILHNVMSRVWVRPCDANAVHHLILREVKNHPLLMQRITFSGEALGEVRTALPISVQIAIRKSRETSVPGSVIACGPAMRQRISVGVANGLGRRCRTCEVTLSTGIAPRSLRIPVPSLHRKFSILAIGHRLPPRSKHFVERGLKQIMVDCCGRNTIHSRTQGLIWREAVRRMRRRYV